jgi:hypothetical protein
VSPEASSQEVMTGFMRVMRLQPLLIAGVALLNLSVVLGLKRSGWAMFRIGKLVWGGFFLGISGWIVLHGLLNTMTAAEIFTKSVYGVQGYLLAVLSLSAVALPLLAGWALAAVLTSLLAFRLESGSREPIASSESPWIPGIASAWVFLVLYHRGPEATFWSSELISFSLLGALAILMIYGSGFIRDGVAGSDVAKALRRK